MLGLKEQSTWRSRLLSSPWPYRPCFLYSQETKETGGASYAVGLLVAAALLAIVFVPIAVELLLGRGFGTIAHHVSFLAQTAYEPMLDLEET